MVSVSETPVEDRAGHAVVPALEHADAPAVFGGAVALHCEPALEGFDGNGDARRAEHELLGGGRPEGRLVLRGFEHGARGRHLDACQNAVEGRHQIEAQACGRAPQAEAPVHGLSFARGGRRDEREAAVSLKKRGLSRHAACERQHCGRCGKRQKDSTFHLVL